jgi:Domain of unknown function (DUF4145)
MNRTVTWQNRFEAIEPVRWECASCGSLVAANVGVKGSQSGWVGSPGHEPHFLVFCPGCGNPTHLIWPGTTSAQQYPRPTYGVGVNGIPDKHVAELFRESRKCITAGCYTAAVLACRKLLMHVAVSLGAPVDKGFAFYAVYLKDNHHITPASEGWVNAIKERGNEANHEIRMATNEEAKDIVDFCTMLLQTVYEYPARAKEHSARAISATTSKATS